MVRPNADVLVPLVARLGQDRFVSALRASIAIAIARAAETYEDSAADEDSLTGALGQALADHCRGSVDLDDGTTLSWRVRYKRFGPKTEKKYGCDGVYELTVDDKVDQTSATKTLPFQAKKREAQDDRRRLVTQARAMASIPDESVVVVYDPKGYVAASASVVASEGTTKGSERDLADVLGREFPQCKVGTFAARYDPRRKVFFVDGDQGEFELLVGRPRHRTQFKVTRKRRRRR